MDEIELARLFDWKHWQFLTPNALVCYLIGGVFTYAFGPQDEKYEKWARPAVCCFFVVFVLYNAVTK